MSGTTIVTIGLLGTSNITTSGTYELDVTGIGTANIQGPGTTGTPISVAVVGLLGAGLVFTTDISNGASEILNPVAGLSLIDTFNIGENASGSILGDGTLELGSKLLGVTLAQDINFFGTDNKLILDPGLNIQLLDSLHNFAAGDTIELKGITTATQAVFTQNPLGGGTVALENAGGTVVGDIILANGTYGTHEFQVTADLNGGVDLTVCFLEGTRLLGLHGDIAVEDMEPGDRLITNSGAMRPVRWVGKRMIDAERHPRPETVWPIRIEAGAIDHGLPERTLYLSPDHALYLDGRLIPAKALVNGRSIVQEKRRHIAYYHVELETHDILLAESLPVESYLETGNRNFFENGGGAMVLHPNMAQAMREAKGCAPFAETGKEVAAIRARIMARLPAPARTSDCGLRAMAGGAALRVTCIDPLTYWIALPEEGADVVLASRSMVPAEQDASVEDRRRLGLDVGELAVESAGAIGAIALDDPALSTGWHATEGTHRWTDGLGVIPASLLGDATALIVRLQALASYPVEAGSGAARPAKPVSTHHLTAS